MYRFCMQVEENKRVFKDRAEADGGNPAAPGCASIPFMERTRITSCFQEKIRK